MGFADPILGQLHEHLVGAEAGWTKWEECLHVQYTPAALTFAPGEPHPVQALVASKRTGNEHLHDALCRPHRRRATPVTPAADVQGFGAPATFTLTAPARVRRANSLLVHGVARHGSASGTFASTLRPSLRVTFSLRSTADLSYQFDYTGTRHGHIH